MPTNSHVVCSVCVCVCMCVQWGRVCTCVCFCCDSQITPQVVPSLTDEQLTSLGIVTVGDRVRLVQCCKQHPLSVAGRSSVYNEVLNEIYDFQTFRICQGCYWTNQSMDWQNWSWQCALHSRINFECSGWDCPLLGRLNYYTLTNIRSRLVLLYEHWTVLQCCLPPCAVLAVGVSTGFSQATWCKGRPPTFINVALVEYLRSTDYTWDEIARSMLVGRTTIWRKLKEAGITLERYSSISDDDLDREVRQLQMRHPHSGQVLICSLLETNRICVPQHRLRESMHRVDPEHCSSRWHQRIQRRTYWVPGPNSLWPIDSHHSLIRWRVIVHGCIDGYSRMIIYLFCANYNKSDTVLERLVRATTEYGLPSCVWSEKGSENFGVCEYMLRRRGTGRHSHIAGKSTHNQRIERLWRDVFHCVSVTYYSLFYYMEGVGDFTWIPWVMQISLSTLLGRDWLSCFHLNWGEIHQVHCSSLKAALQRYPGVFQDGLGTFKGSCLTICRMGLSDP